MNVYIYGALIFSIPRRVAFASFSALEDAYDVCTVSSRFSLSNYFNPTISRTTIDALIAFLLPFPFNNVIIQS